MPNRRYFLQSLFAASASLAALKSDALARITPTVRGLNGRRPEDLAQDGLERIGLEGDQEEHEAGRREVGEQCRIAADVGGAPGAGMRSDVRLGRCHG